MKTTKVQLGNPSPHKIGEESATAHFKITSNIAIRENLLKMQHHEYLVPTELKKISRSQC